MTDTNGLIDLIIANVEIAIGWAEADKEASLEGGHEEQALDDTMRIRILTDVKNQLKECFK